MPLARKPRYLNWILVALAGVLALGNFGLAEASFQPAPTTTPQERTPTPSVTSTPRPNKISGPTATPSVPPEEEIGSTNGIVGWGVIMVAIVLAVLLWHRPDWAGKRPTR